MILDFMVILNRKINSLPLFSISTIGLLRATESISIMAMPGGVEKKYMDGMRDKAYQIQVNAKSKNQESCMNSLTLVYQSLENLVDLPSDNGSYEFNDIQTMSLPSLVMQDEQGYYIFALSISAEITIYEGVL